VNILHLRYAVEVEKTSSITKAAENLYMGQPNVSKAIKELEASIGVTIFRRTSQGVVPTQRGKEFLSYARSILAQIDQMESMYRARRQEKLGFAVSVPRASYISYAFARFVAALDREKMLEINYCETNSLKTIENVTQDDFALGIIRYPLSEERYYLGLLADRRAQHHVVWDFTHVLLMAQDHPLARAEEIRPGDLTPFFEIKHGDIAAPTDPSSHAASALSRHAIFIYERGSQIDLLNQVADSYIWCSPLPPALLARYRLVQRRCVGVEQSHRDAIIYPRGHKLSKLDKAFITELTAVKDTLASQQYA
jgi:DNA-binding transcriptional LysR family regulator